MRTLFGTGSIIRFDDAMQRLRPYINPKDLSPLQFQYVTRLWSENNYQFTCNLTSSYVETEITCPHTGNCGATRIRRSRLPSPPPAWTFLDMPAPSQPVLFGSLLKSASGKNMTPTILEKSLSNLSLTVGSGNDVPLTSAKYYSVGLTQLLNAYFTVMNGMYAITGGLYSRTAYYDDKNSTFMIPENSKYPEGSSWYQSLEREGLKGKA
jgi:hypothetical protein